MYLQKPDTHPTLWQSLCSLVGFGLERDATHAFAKAEDRDKAEIGTTFATIFVLGVLFCGIGWAFYSIATS